MFLDRNFIYIKGLSLAYIESSEFQELPDARKQEYIRQFNLMKDRFINESDSDDEVSELSPEEREEYLAFKSSSEDNYIENEDQEPSLALDNKEIHQIERNNFLKCASGQVANNMSETESLFYLNEIVNRELETKEEMMKVFSCLSPKESQDLAGMANNNEKERLVDIYPLNGETESNTINETIMRNYSVLESFTIPEEENGNETIFDSISNVTSGDREDSENIILLKKIFENSSVVINTTDDSKIVKIEPKLLIKNIEELNLDESIMLITAKYFLEDNLFFNNYSDLKPFKDNRDEITKLKDEITDICISNNNTKNSLALIEGNKEMQVKLSVPTIVEYLKSIDILEEE